MLRRSLSRIGFMFALLGALLVGTAGAQDFQKSYASGAGTSVAIANVSGNVHVTGYSGETISVAAYREGRDRDLVQVEDLSSGNQIKLRARYPNNCNCDASIRFEVRVPRSTRYKLGPLSTASGNVEVRDASGDVTVQTASGNVLIKDVSGAVNAQSASGDVNVEITRIEGAERMSFSTASGNVNVKLPDNPDADIHMSTASGSVRTDFPLDMDRRQYGPGASARGQLGNGTVRIRLSSASGDVTLSRM
ncbi:MAG TPA: DUF4097 family beta strand repeat-containing protein [Pyrinomonadaceae bacterium]|nr:DUF4097 family beta strand repeat-containing protein [Pyrinomonadaceae bacterium]